jgi:hypothetical protein
MPCVPNGRGWARSTLLEVGAIECARNVAGCGIATNRLPEARTSRRPAKVPAWLLSGPEADGRRLLCSASRYYNCCEIGWQALVPHLSRSTKEAVITGLLWFGGIVIPILFVLFIFLGDDDKDPLAIILDPAHFFAF